VRWRKGQSSDYVIDRRGTRTGGMAIGGLGGAGVIVFLLLQLFGGGSGGGPIGMDDLLGQLGTGAGPTEDVVEGTGGAADDEAEDFMRAVMNDLNIVWTDLFAEESQTYETTSLVLFSDAVSTGCGQASAATGPFYCPPDGLAYIDVTFFEELRTRFGAPGEFAQAYVIAHEVGHHVQNLLGILGRRESNEDSVRVELMADCYAGIWAHETFTEGSDIELTDSDIDDALEAAAAIGDDRIQPGSSPESWTHGSAEQRTRWFRTGYASGAVEDCDTFAADV